jgi:hypothetical protein
MEIKKRQFPYPIMARWSDDIQYCAESILKPTIDKATNAYIFEYNITIKNNTMLELLRIGKGKLFMHIECSNALYRKIFPLNIPIANTDTAQGKVTISANEIHGSADVTIVLISNDDITNYKPEGIHPDYEGISCSLKKGDFVAVIETYKVPLRQDYDLLKQISTIIVFKRDEDRETGTITIDFSEDKLIATLPKKLHDSYYELKDNGVITSILTSMLVVPVLMEGLNHIKELWQDKGSQTQKWFNLLCKKLDDMKCDMSNASPIEVAQKILDMPYERATKELKELLGQTI